MVTRRFNVIFNCSFFNFNIGGRKHITIHSNSVQSILPYLWLGRRSQVFQVRFGAEEDAGFCWSFE